MTTFILWKKEKFDPLESLFPQVSKLRFWRLQILPLPPFFWSQMIKSLVFMSPIEYNNQIDWNTKPSIAVSIQLFLPFPFRFLRDSKWRGHHRPSHGHQIAKVSNNHPVLFLCKFSSRHGASRWRSVVDRQRTTEDECRFLVDPQVTFETSVKVVM
jgi:hypothetical protein